LQKNLISQALSTLSNNFESLQSKVADSGAQVSEAAGKVENVAGTVKSVRETLLETREKVVALVKQQKDADSSREKLEKEVNFSLSCISLGSLHTLIC